MICCVLKTLIQCCAYRDMITITTQRNQSLNRMNMSFWSVWEYVICSIRYISLKSSFWFLHVIISTFFGTWLTCRVSWSFLRWCLMSGIINSQHLTWSVWTRRHQSQFRLCVVEEVIISLFIIKRHILFHQNKTDCAVDIEKKVSYAQKDVIMKIKFQISFRRTQNNNIKRKWKSRNFFGTSCHVNKTILIISAISRILKSNSELYRFLLKDSDYHLRAEETRTGIHIFSQTTTFNLKTDIHQYCDKELSKVILMFHYCHHILTLTSASLPSFPHSVVTEGPEARQHRDAARHRPHRQVAHTGVRVPGESNKASASTVCMTHTFYCWKWIDFTSLLFMTLCRLEVAHQLLPLSLSVV